VSFTPAVNFKFAAGVKDTGGQPLMSWILVVHLLEKFEIVLPDNQEGLGRR
jgi:hypothetical protein